MEWKDIFILTTTTLSFLLHLFGVKWMMTQRVTALQQKYFLINLSFAEMAKCLASLIRITLLEKTKLYKNIKAGASMHYIFVTNTALLFPFFTVMLLLTQDRFFAIYLHMRYPNTWFCRNKNKLISIGWFLCGLYIVSVTSITEIWREYLKHVNKLRSKLFPSLTILLIVQFLIVYGYIVFTVFLIHNRQSRKSNYKLVIPFVIIISYIIFKGIPDIAMLHYDKYFPQRWGDYYDVGTRLNILTDALIYLYMQSIVRKKVSHSFRSIRSSMKSKTTATVRSSKNMNGPVKSKEISWFASQVEESNLQISCELKSVSFINAAADN